MERKSCEACGTEFFHRNKGESLARFNARRFCSRKCYYGNPKENNKIQAVCVICTKTFGYWPSQGEAKCCSRECSKRLHQSDSYRSKISAAAKGRIISPETRRKLSEAQKGKRTGSENHNWKGDDVKYRSLHDWVVKEKGTPDECEHCGRGSKEKKRLVWANKSHEYRRDVNDWMRLCYPCHRKYDFPHEKVRQ